MSRRRRGNRGGAQNARKIRRLLNQQKYLCYWCGCRLAHLGSLNLASIRIVKHHFVVWKDHGKLVQALIASVDHLIPKSRGGEDGQENLVMACKWCNEARNNKTVIIDEYQHLFLEEPSTKIC